MAAQDKDPIVFFLDFFLFFRRTSLASQRHLSRRESMQLLWLLESTVKSTATGRRRGH